MDLLFVHPVHPQFKHVSSIRAREFAHALTQKGHRVVLLSAAMDESTLEQGQNIAQHDWQKPYVMAPAMAQNAPAFSARWAAFRRMDTFFRMVTVGGYKGDWAEAAFRAMMAQSAHFRPDAIWTTFGSMEAVILAQRLSVALKAPWILDLKDNWELYVPKGLRHLMSWRICGWSALTANSELTFEKGRRWLRGDATLLYSGVDAMYLTPQPRLSDAKESFRINVIGGLYTESSWRQMWEGIALWASKRAETEPPVVVHYYGTDQALFRKVVSGGSGRVVAEAKGYVAPEALAQACQNAAVNAYVGYSVTFHHKLLELLSCGRPLLVCPKEREEAKRFCVEVDGLLLEAETPVSIAAALERVDEDWRLWNAPTPNSRCQRFSWDVQSERLERVCIDVTRNKRSRSSAA